MKNIFTVLILFFAYSVVGQIPRILVEGKFDDWHNISVAHEDGSGDEGSSNIDFRKLWIANDEAYLFLRLEVGKEMNLQSDNNIVMYLDTDNNASSGIAFNGIGAEITYNFGQHEGTARFENNSYFLDHEDIGLVTAPTVTSDVFEIAVRRDGSIAGNTTFPNNTIKVAFRDENFAGDWTPGINQTIEYTITNENLEPLPEYSIPKTGGETFRAVSYNVLDNGFFDFNRRPAFERIFQALDPDIIGFQEIYNQSATSVKNVVEDFLPSGAGEEWFSAKITPDIICVSRYKIKQAFFIDGAGNSANGAFLIEMPAPFYSDMLFIVAHTPCCDNDFGRQQEVDAIMAFVRDAKSGNGTPSIAEDTPIIISGDMNLVGDNQQLHTFLFGDIVNENTYGGDFIPDWDGTAFDDASPYATNLPLAFTWSTQFSSFSPGRLDFIIYSGSVLEPKNAFNLYSPALTNAQLNTYGLQWNDTDVASDHIPVVVDFGEPEPVSTFNVFSENQGLKIEKIYPNPSDNQFFTEFSLKKSENVKAVLTDALGREIRVLFNENRTAGNHVYSFEKEGLNSGIYWLKLMTESEVAVRMIEVVD